VSWFSDQSERNQSARGRAEGYANAKNDIRRDLIASLRIQMASPRRCP